MIALKQHGSARIAHAFAESLELLAELNPIALTADFAIVPPSRRDAFRRRGFTPIQCVTDAAGIHTVRPFMVSEEVRDQRGLNSRERRHNLSGGFTLRRRWHTRLTNRRVLLIDDVITTGATLAELHRAVCDAGGTVVGMWTLASTERSG